MMSEDEVYPKKRTSSAARPSETVQHENGTEEDFYAEQDGPGYSTWTIIPRCNDCANLRLLVCFSFVFYAELWRFSRGK